MPPPPLTGGPVVYKSVQAFENRDQEQQERLIWLFKDAVSHRLENGEDASPYFDFDCRSRNFESWYDAWKEECENIMPELSNAYGTDKISHQGHLWRADYNFYLECMFLKSNPPSPNAT